ncbi:MAG TPA: hypothetical protein VF746_28305 [Longimicrobium sp.]
MSNRKISVEVDEETARLIEEVVRAEERSESRIAAEALELYVRLPDAGRVSLRYVLANGTPDDFARMLREVARAMLDARYEISHARLIASIKIENPERFQTEEDIIAEAVRLTSFPQKQPD